MTGHPEAVLARELALCYTPLCLVTDTDAGVDEGEGVTHEEVMTVFAENLAKMRNLLMSIIESLPDERSCGCGAAARRPQAPLRPPLAALVGVYEVPGGLSGAWRSGFGFWRLFV